MFDHLVGLALKGLKEREQKRGWYTLVFFHRLPGNCKFNWFIRQPDYLTRLQSDSKKGNHYRHFTSEFVLEVLYHPITAASKLVLEIIESHFTQGEIETLGFVSLKGGLSARMT